MGDDRLGLFGAVSIAVGGMIGGGVFSVLGVVVQISHAASWLAFTLASLGSLCAAYSYLKLNAKGENRGGSVAQLQEFVDNTTLSGMVGWTLLFGYVGAIAMYAYAFGSFAIGLVGRTAVAGLPLHPILAVVAVGIFVGFNLLGARATGTSEEALVVTKVSILVAFIGLGLWYGWKNASLEYGLSTVRQGTPVIMATAISFVSFQGWQLLMYDQDQIADPLKNLPIGVYSSILICIVIDALIAVVVTSLVSPDLIASEPDRALAYAVEQTFVGHAGFVVVSVAALFSTGSAINGTLFSSANLAKGMISDSLLPEEAGDGDADGVPERTVLLIGVLSAAFAAYGSLNGITSFGSIAFMVVFGAMCYLAVRERDDDDINPIPPALGALGMACFVPLLVYHLWSAERHVFWVVCVVAAAVLALELLYFTERDTISEGIEEFERLV
ncbi:amino acid transporter [Halarchaeum rubridurum]|uniref:Amino acid transporter n=1 Tax=Halarchaeum rubridurum TaxID=489911 RepID=A0A830FZU4_9EURY|nr:APC family permease [Halarchaeum rubridurum]MBP1955197.1 amino acid transporter [Halarchaeum rubridurum]GGM68215.1 amino acid transporter [Halarchaeum rubridurum]